MESIRIQRTSRVFLMSAACIGTADFVAIANKSDRPQIDIGFYPAFYGNSIKRWRHRVPQGRDKSHFYAASHMSSEINSIFWNIINTFTAAVTRDDPVITLLTLAHRASWLAF